MPRLAIIQQAPVVLDRDATLKEAVRWVDTAAAAGAALIVLPESFVPCYPAWIWRLRPGPDSGLTAKLHARLVDNAVSIARGDLAPLCNAAREHKVTIVCGMPGPGRAMRGGFSGGDPPAPPVRRRGQFGQL